MAKCKWCDKGGFFTKVSKDGLCATCVTSVILDIEHHSNVIYEAMHVFEREQDRAQKLAECDKVIASAQHLLKYENKGLATCSPPAKLVVEEYSGFRKQLAG